MVEKEQPKQDVPAEKASRTFRDRVRERYPDLEPQDEEGTEAMYSKYADDTDAEVGAYKEQVKKINDLLSADEDAATIISDMLINKVPFRVAIAKHLSAEDLIVEEGDADYDAYQKAFDERLSKANQKKETSAKLETNEQESVAVLDSFCQEKGYDQEQSDRLNAFMQDIFSNLLYKKITAEMLTMFDRAMNFDSAVSEAEKTGELRGKNAAIEAKRAKENEKGAGDGMPELNGGGKPVVEKAQKTGFFSDVKPRPKI